jgi:hypothetical protein
MSQIPPIHLDGSQLLVSRLRIGMFVSVAWTQGPCKEDDEDALYCGAFNPIHVVHYQVPLVGVYGMKAQSSVSHVPLSWYSVVPQPVANSTMTTMNNKYMSITAMKHANTFINRTQRGCWLYTGAGT